MQTAVFQCKLLQIRQISNAQFSNSQSQSRVACKRTPKIFFGTITGVQMYKHYKLRAIHTNTFFVFLWISQDWMLGSRTSAYLVFTGLSYFSLCTDGYSSCVQNGENWSCKETDVHLASGHRECDRKWKVARTLISVEVALHHVTTSWVASFDWQVGTTCQKVGRSCFGWRVGSTILTTAEWAIRQLKKFPGTTDFRISWWHLHRTNHTQKPRGWVHQRKDTISCDEMPHSQITTCFLIFYVSQYFQQGHL